MRSGARWRRRRGANTARWEGGTILSAIERAKEFCVGNLGRFGQHECYLAAIHVHHAVHRAFALTEVQRYTGESAGGQHEQ